MKSWKRKTKRRTTAAQRARLQELRARLRDATKAGWTPDEAAQIARDAVAGSVHDA